MERLKRRWWTRLLSVFAALVIVAATFSGLFQLAVFALPSYRSDLSSWVTQVAGQPVQIGGISLVWRGLIPQVDLSDITLYAKDSDDEVLSADRLSLGFGLWRLLRADLTPTTMELAGVSLEARLDDEGRLHITGFDEPGSTADFSQWLKQLVRFDRLSLRDCEVELSAPFLPEASLTLKLNRAQIRKTSGGAALSALLLPPATYAQQIEIAGEIADPIEDPAQWAGQVTTTVTNLQPHPWLRGHMLPDTQVLIGKTRLQLVVRLAQGKLSALETHLEAANLQMKRSEQVVALKTLDLRAQAQAMPEGWQLQLTQLMVDGENQARAIVKVVSKGDQQTEIAADADLLKLNRITPWLAYVDGSPLVHLLSRATGQASGVNLRLSEQADALSYVLRAQVQALGLTSTATQVGFEQISGELTATENEGRFAPTGDAVVLHLPQEMDAPVRFDKLSGDVTWQRGLQGWQVQMPAFAWAAASTQGQGRVALLLPTSGASPVLDLAATFNVADVTALKPYMPKHWGAELHQWLQHAIISGQARNGNLLIQGPLADFPYADKKTGRWSLDADVSHIDLAFLPDWPTLRQLGAHLRFQGNGLDVAANVGTIADSPLESASARFLDFNRPLLEVTGKVNGDFARFYDFAAHSPLQKILSGLMENTSASGKGSVAIKLEVPMDVVAQTQSLQVSGSINLAGVDLLYKPLARSVRGIVGTLNFNQQGVTADKLSGQFEDVALTGRIEARPKTQGVVKAEFDYGFNPIGSGVSAFVPQTIRELLHGATHWRAELPLGAAQGGLTLSTDALGLALALPEPLGKAPSQSVPLQMQITNGASGRTQLHIVYGRRLDADISIVKGAAQGVNLVLGGAAAPPSLQPGLFISGNVKAADASLWAGVLKGAASADLPLMKADLQVDLLTYASQAIRDVRMAFKPNADGWAAALSGAGAEGDLMWKRAESGQLFAHLKHLRLELDGTQIAGEIPRADFIFDPNDAPTLNVDCEHTFAGDKDFGNLLLVSKRMAGGQQIETLKLSYGLVQLEAQGEWKRVNDLSSAALKFDLKTDAAGTVLKALGFAPNLTAKLSHFNGDLLWAPSLEGVDWAMARGRVGLELKEGTIKSVEPGVGRVLGLLNFFALPRRFLLDFGDVVNEGLGFDSINGNFQLADGNARTQDLAIKGPSMNMEIRGRIGLAAHDFDQQVSVHPDYSTGVTVGATIAGGPIGGVVALLAQQLFQKPIDKLTEMNYRITGPWDNPKIDSGSGSAP